MENFDEKIKFVMDGGEVLLKLHIKRKDWDYLKDEIPRKKTDFFTNRLSLFPWR